MGFFSSVLIIVAVLSLVKVSILLLRKSGDKKANSLLSIFFLIVFLYSLQGFVIEAGYLKDLPGFYVWPLPIYALMHVVMFFYFKSILDKSITWKASYTLLFIPFLLALVDVFLFSLKPSTEKISIINDAILNPADRFEKQYGLFALKEHFLIRYTWSLFALALIWIKFIPFLLNKGLEKHQKTINKWVFSFLIVLSAVVFSTFLLVLQKCFPLSLVVIGIYYSKILIVLFVGFIFLSALPFYFPDTLYGFFEAKVKLVGVKNDAQVLKICKSEEDKIKFGLDIEIFNNKLNKFENEHLYLSQNFDINVLANYLEIPIHHLSYFLNQHYGLSFAVYRNKLRMEHAVKLIQEGFLCESTIEALAWECGFVSRSAFSKTFKAVIGDNPSDYAAKFQLAF